MSYSTKIVVAPEYEPLHEGEVSEHLRGGGEVNVYRVYIPAARRRIEQATNRQLVTATIELSLDCFPSGTSPILVPKAPLRSINSITYIDSAGDSQTLDPSMYTVDTSDEPGRVFPAFGTVWPATQSRNLGVMVTVNFDAGYGGESRDVPAELREAMLLMIGHYYYHREEVVMGAKPSVLPRAVDDLLQAYCYGDEFTQYGSE